MGQMHLKYWSRVAGTEIIALADLRPQLLQLAADKFAIPLRYPSHSDLIKNPDIEAVVVATRRYNNAYVSKDCLAAGKHVFSEKPLAMTMDQATSLVALADENNRHLIVGYQRRHDAGTQIAYNTFEQLVRTGELGKVTFVKARNFSGKDRLNDNDYVMSAEKRPEGFKWPSAPDWLPSQYHHTYDLFVNVFSHDLNIFKSFIKKMPKVKYVNFDYSQGFVFVLDYNDFLLSCTGGFNEQLKPEEKGEWDESLEIFFEKGRLDIQFAPPLIHTLSTHVELTRFGKGSEILSDGKNQRPAFELQSAAFIEAMTDSQKSITNAKDAIDDLLVTELIWKHYISTRSKRASN